MANIIRIPDVPEAQGVFALLAFLADPAACKKRLAEMEAMRAEVNALIDKVGTAETIDKLLIQAQTDRKMATEELAAARAKADSLRADASAEILLMRSSLAVERETFEKQQDAAKLEVAERERNAHDKYEAGETALARAAKEAAAAQKMMDAALGIKREFEERNERLRAAAAAAAQ